MVSTIKDWATDMRVAIAFLTRVPMPHPEGAHPPAFSRAHRVFPIVGAAIGAAAGLFYLAFTAFGLPPLAAAALALGASAILTGALHEDGLADVADGFGGGRDKAAKLEIMRDSRLGTYGALMLLVSFVAKLSALAALSPAAALPCLVASHALARGMLPVMVVRMPRARNDGLAVAVERPDRSVAATAVALALLVAFMVLPWPEALGATLVAAAGAAAIAVLAKRQIGGLTGDVLGGAEQIAETAVLLFLATRFG